MRFDLSRFPRVSLGHLPTPLEPLDRLSRHLGGPRIWIKRDDCTGLATGGNKTRKLEYLLGDALAKSADTIVTFGAVQSNHARQTAAACAKLGLECHLVLSRVVPRHEDDYETSGNVLLDRIVGAHIHMVAATAATSSAAALTRDLERKGRRVYQIPTGGSNATGALGYVACAYELLDQADALEFQPDLLIHASSSGGTQAGLTVGLRGTTTEIVGVNVSDPSAAAIEARINQLTRDTLESLGSPGPSPLCNMRHAFLGTAYGIPNDTGLNAIRTLGKLEGIVTDPVYSGKALAAVLEIAISGKYRIGTNLVFLHTGGVGAISTYESVF